MSVYEVTEVYLTTGEVLIAAAGEEGEQAVEVIKESFEVDLVGQAAVALTERELERIEEEGYIYL